MAEAIFYEARGESTKGKKAVAKVILNRVKSKRFPNTVCGVIHQKGQFQWTKRKNRKKGKGWTAAKKMAKRVMTHGVSMPSIDRALFFSSNGVVLGKRVAKIGNHTFFR